MSRRTSAKIFMIAVLLALLVAVYFIVFNKSAVAPSDTSTAVEESALQLVAQPAVITNENRKPPIFDSVKLQAALDQWVVSLPAGSVASVTITSDDGLSLASYNQDEVYFAASIYKLYVAYAGYQQVDEGLVNPDEVYVNGNSRLECLDLMIRESDSPCAETLWNEIGKQVLTDKLKTYGITNTNMSAITTTSADAAVILARISTGNGLSEVSQQNYLDSMLGQPAKYRRGLPSGFSEKVTVHNKVGWNESKEWHDTAVVEVADGRQFIITVLSDSVGLSRIADLGTIVESQIIL